MQQNKSKKLLPDDLSRKQFISWLWHYVANKKLVVSFITLGTVLRAFLASTIPVFIGIIIDEVLSKPTGNYSVDMEKVETICFILLFFVIISGILGYAINATNDWLAFKIESEVRAEFYDSIQSKPLSFHIKTRTGDIMALATNDTRQISGMVSPGIRLVSQLFISTFFVALLTVTVLDIRFALISIFFIPFYFYAVKWYSDSLGPISRVFQRQFSDISIRAQDSVVGAKIVRAFSGEEYETEFFSKAVTDFRDTWIDRTKVQSKYFPPLILNLLLITTTAIGIVFFINGELSLGKLVAFNGLLLTLEGPTSIIEFATNIAQAGLAGASRIFIMMNQSYEEETEVQRNNKLPFPEIIEGKIEFKNVTFKYNDTGPPVIEDISFTIFPGENVAIVGATGSGKSTLTKLLLRFYEPKKGTILLDGVDIRKYKLVDLRRKIGLIEQDVFLFSTSIKNNISFGKFKTTQDEVENAAKQAQAHEFIMETKDGYKTRIGERGYTLSGGQRQRLAIARTFITNPEVLILDDSTSAIDSATEEKIVKAIDTLINNRTAFIITHRISTIRRADKIIVIKRGKLVAEGNHDSLLSTSPDYRRIFGRHIELPPLQQIQSKKKTGAKISEV